MRPKTACISIISIQLAVCLAALSVPGRMEAQTAKQTYDVVRDFNTTNGTGSVFTYGEGGFPGEFAKMTKVVSGCDGIFGETCVSNELMQPYWSGAVLNRSGDMISMLTIRQPQHLLRLDPQLTAGSIVRFTAPLAGTYDIEGWFESIDTNQHSTAVLVFAGGNQVFYDLIPWYSFGTQKSFSAPALSLSAGATIDFIVKTASNCCYLSTGLAARISRTLTASNVTSQTRVENTGYIYSRATRQFLATVRVTNKGAQPISGPISVVFKGLPSGVDLVNKTGWIGTDPYLTLPNSTNVLPGATVTGTIQFTNQSVSFINYAADVYAGTL
jgi:hypothetical protein